MSYLLYAEINIVGIVTLLLLLLNMNRNGIKDIPVDQRIFNGIMLLNLLIFLFDTGMWLADGSTFMALRAINYLSTTLYYIFNPLICFFWLMYTDFKVYESRVGLRKRMKFYAIPAFVSMVMSLVSPFTGWLFTIDEFNRYSRGPLFFVMAISALIYLVISFTISIIDVRINGWEENKSINLHLIIFPIGITAAAAIQIMFFGVSIIWVCCMLASVSIFINIQNSELLTDYLTGLYNRRHFDRYLQRRTKVRREGRLLFAIMLDLDEFKSINDNHGHLAGDYALVQTAELLRQVCKGNDDFIARMGGDEFIILGERAEVREVERLMREIHSRVIEHNQSRQSEYALLLSMGFSIFGTGDTVDSFLAAADKQMYRNKQESKRLRAKENPTS